MNDILGEKHNGGGHRWTRAAIALLAVGSALALAACGDDDSGSSDSGGATAAMSGGSETVSVDSLGDAGDVLVDADGAALYRSDKESSGKIVCTGDCTNDWVPVTVAQGESPTGSADIESGLGTVKRPDGDTQVTFDGEPLYSFADEGPGEVTGDGFVDSFAGTQFTWNVVTPTGASSGGDTSDSSSGGGSGYSY